MIGKIIDMNVTDALIGFQDGTTVDVGTAHLPPSSKIGDRVNINPKSTLMSNDKFKNIFSVNIL